MIYRASASRTGPLLASSSLSCSRFPDVGLKTVSLSQFLPSPWLQLLHIPTLPLPPPHTSLCKTVLDLCHVMSTAILVSEGRRGSLVGHENAAWKTILYFKNKARLKGFKGKEVSAQLNDTHIRTPVTSECRLSKTKQTAFIIYSIFLPRILS